MLNISLSRLRKWKPSLVRLHSLLRLLTTEPQPESSEPIKQYQRPLRRAPRPPEKIEDTIFRMMSQRAWTTRLQNSIRSIVPEFNHTLVYNVLHGARNWEHALRFFRWVDRSGLFRHDRETNIKMMEILGAAGKVNLMHGKMEMRPWILAD